MNAKSTNSIQIVAALIAGIAVGVLLDRVLVKHRIGEERAMIELGLGAPGKELPFKPADAAQEAKIRLVLDQHARRVSGIHDRYGKEIEASYKSLKSDLDPLLTPEQKAQLEKMISGATPRFGGPGGFPLDRGPAVKGPGGFPGDRAPGGLRPGGPGPMVPGPGGPGGRRPGGPGEGSPIVGDLPFTRGPLGGQLGLAIMKSELKLSEEQAAKIRSAQVEFEQKTWTPASTAPPPGPDEMRKAEQELHEAILKVLTDEQKEKLAKLSARGQGGPRGPYPFP